MNTSHPKKLVNGVFYITPIENLSSIFKHGVLSHNQSEALTSTVKIYDEEVIRMRRDRITPDGNTLWHFANFYFQPRNPMMYRIYRCEGHQVVVLRLNQKLVDQAHYVSVGNAASASSHFLPPKQGIGEMQSGAMQKILNAGGWSDSDGSKRLIMSELLVPECAPPSYIDTVYVPDENSVDKVGAAPKNVHIVPLPNLFFRNDRTRKLDGTKITLVDGDMFFSNMQTLTISVNTMGIMGAGLASRAKESFPALYVAYQKMCKDKELTVQTPCLYRGDISFDYHLADSPQTLKHTPNDGRKFLLFATKQNWRNPSKEEYVESGLQWLVKNAAKEGIKSLAVPALGCGLGGLPWHRAGPLMCQYLKELDIDCEIYLPRERNKRIPDAQLSDKFLLYNQAE